MRGTDPRPIAARDEVIRAALRFLSAEKVPENDPNYDAELDYSEDWIALAARSLVQAIDRMDDQDQPVGWGGSVRPLAGAPYCIHGVLPADACSICSPAVTP